MKENRVKFDDREKVDVGIPDSARETREDNRFLTMAFSMDSFWRVTRNSLMMVQFSSVNALSLVND